MHLQYLLGMKLAGCTLARILGLLRSSLDMCSMKNCLACFQVSSSTQLVVVAIRGAQRGGGDKRVPSASEKVIASEVDSCKPLAGCGWLASIVSLRTCSAQSSAAYP